MIQTTTISSIVQKVVLYASYNIISESEEGYLLLKLFWSYLELDMYASLTVHTESTISAGRAELLTFESLLHVCVLL
jgi:hypothetical protein